MDDPMATVVAAIIGAGAALLAGAIGAVIATLPTFTLEKRQARKESREAVRLLLADFIKDIYDYALYRPGRSGAEVAAAGAKLLTMSAQLGLVLREKDEVVFDHLNAGVGLIAMNDGHGMVNSTRLAIAATMADQLPKWYRGTLDAKELRTKATEYNNLRALIGAARAEAASSDPTAPTSATS